MLWPFLYTKKLGKVNVFPKKYPYFAKKTSDLMRLYTFSLFICFLACLSCSSPTTAGKEDYDCKHCGMPSQDYPQWQTRVQFDTRKQWFCSPRCMFATYHQTKKKPQNTFAVLWRISDSNRPPSCNPAGYSSQMN